MLVAGVLVTGCGAAVADPQTAAPSSRTPVTVPSIVEDTASATTGSSATASSGEASVSASALASSRRSSDTTTSAAATPKVKVTSTLKAGSGGVLGVKPADLAAATIAVSKMTDLQRAASVLMPTAVEHLTSDDPGPVPGGVIVMGSKGVPNGTDEGTPEQVADLVQQVQSTRTPGTPPLLVATDQEYGDVVRLVNGFTAFPGASELAAIPETELAVELTEQVAGAAAAELLAVGITVNFAPDADLLPADGSPSKIGDRSFGSDPERVGRLVSAAVTGYQRAGLAATVKHFPGIGGLAADTHTSLPTVLAGCEQWNSSDAVPMRAGVDAGTTMVMTGHVLMPAVGVTETPASLSPAVVTDLLKGEGRGGCTGLGFRGIAVTDSMKMRPVLDADTAKQPAVVAALLAGEDLLLMPDDPTSAAAAITAAVDSGELPADRLTDAATKVYALRLAMARVPKPAMDVVGSAAHQEVADAAAAAAGGG